MRANLHIHSRFSDGTQWPKDIVDRVVKLNLNKKYCLDLIALTDHDNIAGNREFLESCEKRGINGIAGVEIDCIGTFLLDEDTTSMMDYKSEILGYFPEGSYLNTQKLLAPVIKNRKQKMKIYLQNASKNFEKPEITWEDFDEFHQGNEHFEHKNLDFTYMKPHLYYYLQTKNILQIKDFTFKEFKNIYFNPSNPSNLLKSIQNIEFDKLKFEEVVKTIQKDKGYAVIPHLALRFIQKNEDPLIIKEELKKNKYRYQAFLEYAYKLKVWGLEMYYYLECQNHPEMINFLNTYIRNLGESKFHFTWGSDCHGIGHISDTMEKFFGEFEGFD